MTIRELNSRLTAFTLVVYWGCILLGLTLPLLATELARRVTALLADGSW